MDKLKFNYFEDSSDWIAYYYQNSMNPEFLQYTDYYVKSLKDYKKILVIEDDHLSFKIIQSFIKDYDSEVKCFYASNEKDALEIIKTFHCDLVIADYFLNDDETGLRICRVIKQQFPEIECSIVSSLRYYQYQEILKYSEIEPLFFEKPVSKNKIIRFLDEVYRGRCV